MCYVHIVLGVFEFFKCYIYIDSVIEGSAGGGKSWELGERVKCHVWGDIPYLSVLWDEDGDDSTIDNVKLYYSISYYWQIVDEEDKSFEGIHNMKIELLNADSIEIGK